MKNVHLIPDSFECFLNVLPSISTGFEAKVVSSSIQIFFSVLLFFVQETTLNFVPNKKSFPRNFRWSDTLVILTDLFIRHSNVCQSGLIEKIFPSNTVQQAYRRFAARRSRNSDNEKK